MPVVKQPKPLPSTLDFVPGNSTRHEVSTGETWWTLSIEVWAADPLRASESVG